MKHILLQKALRYKKRKKIEAPKGFMFDCSLGAWISKIDQSLLIQSANFPATSTKKEDIETGEDQKGE
jgi:hypothetical protein